MPASWVSGISQDVHHSSHVHFLLASQPFPHGNPAQQMPAETHFVTSAAWREIEVLQCQCEDIGGSSWGSEQPQQKACSRGAMEHLGSSPPGRWVQAWEWWTEGHDALKAVLRGKGFSELKKMSWIMENVLSCCANTKPDWPTELTAQVWEESQHKTQADKQEEMSWGMFLLWEWVMHTTDSWCSNWTTFFYSQAGY